MENNADRDSGSRDVPAGRPRGYWQTSRRRIEYGGRTLIMAILNVTPDSFSDGGRYQTAEAALRRAEQLLDEGADILDVGGESTRPKSERVDAGTETERVVPVIEEICKRFDVPVSVDTSKSEVARRALEAGAEIVNDVSGLRFDPEIAETAVDTGGALVLMHLRGRFETMHSLEPVEDILEEVAGGFLWSIERARERGLSDERICLDVGIGFSKTQDQNLELLARLGELRNQFARYPMLVGTSRKSFIGRILGDVPPPERIAGTLGSNVLAVLNGADILRVHDVREHVQAVRVAEAILNRG